MRKALLLVFLVIGAAILLSPIAGGILTARAYESAAANTAEIELGTGMRIDMNPNEYERGLLSSRARTEIRPENDGPELVFVHTIFHGPLPYQRIDRAPALSVIETQLDTTALGIATPSPLEITTTIDLDRDLHLQLRSTPVDHERLKLRGASGELDMSNQGQSIRGRIDLPELRLVDETGELRFTLLAGRGDISLEASDTGLPIGEASYALDELELLGGERDLYARNLSSAQQSAIDAESGLLSSTTKLSFDELRIADTRLEDAELEIEARNLDAAAMSRIRERQRSVREERQLWNVLQEEAPQLLKASPEIRVPRAALQTEYGPLEIELEIRGRSEMANVPLVNVAALLMVFDIDLDAALSRGHVDHVARAIAVARASALQQPVTDEELERQAALLRQRFIEDGYLTVEATPDGEERFSTQVRYSGGALTLNDRPFDPNSLLARGPGGQ